MSKIKIGAQVTAKVRPTKVTVSGTFQGYRLEDQEDPTSICGTVLHVKDGMQHLDYVYVDSIKVCESKDERIRKALLRCCDDWEKGQFGCMAKEDVPAILAYLEKQKEQKPIEWSEDFEQNIRILLHDKLTWRSEDGSMSSTVFIDDKTLKDIVAGIWFYVGKEASKYPNKELKVEQNPAEWSEDDEKNIEKLDGFLSEVFCYGHVYVSQKDKEELQNWLKSLRPQPHWKPSEEQMDALMWAITWLVENGNHTVSSTLADLRSNLQKLM